MGKYLDALKGKMNSEAPYQHTDITDICLSNDQMSVMSGAYLSIFKKISSKDPRLSNPLKALRKDSEIDFLYDDFLWLRNLLVCIAPDQTRELLTTYKDKWITAMDGEPVAHKQQNSGRFAANTWIRKNINILPR